MSGGADVTVVWVAPDAGTAAPGEDAQRAIGEWARARGLRARATADASSSPPLPLELAVADRVEKELERSRDAIAAADADAAERALARAETQLREHPELPQAAWLRAEVSRSWAARWTRLEPRDELRARTAWQEADALDGGRAAGVGEVPFPPRPPTAVTLTLSGSGSRTMTTRLDGTELAGTTSGDGSTSYALQVAPAEHQLVVSLDGQPVFASWLTIAAGEGNAPTTLPIRVGDDSACSAASLAGVTRDALGAVNARGVTCDHWVAAVPAARRGAILVARCDGSSCGPFVEWRSEAGLGAGGMSDGGGPGPRPVTPHAGSWPAWATWTAVGVGVVAATTLTLIAAGVFDSRATEQRFVAGGVRIE